jgi:hypothetical protein
MPSIINEDIKVDVTMHEEQSGPTLVEDSTPEYLSWSLTTTYAKFWKSVTYCILVSGLRWLCLDRYVIQAERRDTGRSLTITPTPVPGNLIAQAAFVKQFGTVIGPAGDLELNALHVSAWGALLT